MLSRRVLLPETQTGRFRPQAPTASRERHRSSALHRTKEPVPCNLRRLSRRADYQLRQLFPEVFAEGKIDFDKLQATLGAATESGPGRFCFTWAGKDDAVALLQTPSRATLVPCPEESVAFDTTKNVFIEGDNLEVLKLLFKPYFGQVKLIYIDPPYNTGQDFVYPDNFADPLATYLQTHRPDRRRGQPAHQQPRNQRPLPFRLAVDDVLRGCSWPGSCCATTASSSSASTTQELAHLVLLLNEVFGEENHLGIFTWVKKKREATFPRRSAR